MFSGVLGSLAAYLAGGPPSAMRSTTLRDAGACRMRGSCDQLVMSWQLLTRKGSLRLRRCPEKAGPRVAGTPGTMTAPRCDLARRHARHRTQREGSGEGSTEEKHGENVELETVVEVKKERLRADVRSQCDHLRRFLEHPRAVTLLEPKLARAL